MGLVNTNLYSEELNTLAHVFKVLGHPARLAILQHLSQCKSCITGEIVTEIGLAQPTISQHLKELKAIGIIQGTIEGTSVNYCIDSKKWDEIGALVSALFSEHHPSKCC